jgi:hypothetical protein
LAKSFQVPQCYEAEFLGFSYGFRPGRGQHNALDALAYGINARKINWILDADVSRFFDTLSREWLIRFVEHRIGDRRIIRLIQKWLKAGVLEDGRLIERMEGTPQGSVASPLLANVYLHYVYDLWVEQWRTRHAKGDMIVVRYADDTIVGFCALELDPQFGFVAALAGACHMQNVVFGYAVDPQFERKEAVRLSRLALSLDDSDPDTLALACATSGVHDRR